MNIRCPETLFRPREWLYEAQTDDYIEADCEEDVVMRGIAYRMSKRFIPETAACYGVRRRAEMDVCPDQSEIVSASRSGKL